MVLTALVASAFAVITVVWWVKGWPLGIDSAVYRAGALAVWHDQPLYGHLTALPGWAPDLPFTYPPVAALLFLPLAALPVPFAWGVMAVLTTVALGVVLRLCLARPANGRWRCAAPVALVLALGLEPVWRTIGFGQVNMVLMALVLVDVLAMRGARSAGVLTGLAAAIKLTPLLFIVHFGLTRRWADAGRALAAFALLTAAGFVALPDAALRYWTDQIFHAHDAESRSWIGNQCLSGVALRLLGDGPRATAVLLVAILVCVVVAALLARLLDQRGDRLGAVVVTAFCGLLVSPVSWSHHWVWVVPLGCRLLVGSRKASRTLTLGAVAVAFSGWTFLVSPADDMWEPARITVRAALSNAYVLAALGTGTIVTVHLFRTRAAAPVADTLTDAEPAIADESASRSRAATSSTSDRSTTRDRP
ncbi:alpha-1,2-mannosyltransferase [Streptoalloteichus tenebrarius]|uniref:Alpha-1,2-mannosyltransferase n=1 Tax=Streptoalloteichus tenebrarius (strain ATCC 17920 / DSM 40477 / JCM 4838 / CBS 697.72 / NBRC 16177 / NCIMB 11028 / NRRL B-12390 / A12253. 1 / ISP 5477) TaxID=1933 RepID=A0ABT1HP99_STRSD|nr:glycosyltransferase 87 family protein [Streptoalloteichus tenebrarius]MCP2257344.1 alpha-1,2-mannosyltransferase [Streptoalloteichus tenebrarius]BFF04254.1 glycosyltransferase 87 family protein [Streptoalloteichus tenebrarius]